MANWQDDYDKKLVTVAEAVKVVKSGDKVAFAMGREAFFLGLALAARKEELKDVSLFLAFPGRDFGWYDPGWEDSFNIELGYVMPVSHNMMAERRCEFSCSDLFYRQSWNARGIDVLLVEVAPPNQHGFCCFGASLWHKKAQVKMAKIVLAEVNKNTIRTYGDNYIHVSEIDYVVEHTPTGHLPGTTDMVGRKTREPSALERSIAEYVSTLVKDGDTIEIGAGGTAEFIPHLGAFNQRQDLGIHTEICPSGMIELVQKGIVTGKCKNIHPGKIACTAVGGQKKHLDYVNENPLFEFYGADYMLDPRVIAANDNMVAINTAIAVDLTGQIAAETVGHRPVGSTGGQLAYATGANLSRGGRSIVVLPSTAKEGTVSRITVAFESGTVVSVPRTLADYIVTEYGIASLRGKPQRERAMELISVAHPDFRADLKKEAEKLFYP